MWPNSKQSAALIATLIFSGAGLFLPLAGQRTEAADPPAARLDGLGDLLPTDAVARLGTARFRHANVVTSIAFAPDGKTLASVSYDQMLSLWEADTGKPIRTWGARTGGLTVAFAPDSKTLVSAGWEQAIRQWDAATGKEIRFFNGHRGPVQSVKFAADGKTLLSASYDQTIRLWDVASGKEIRSFAGHTNTVHAAVFSPDGKTVASASADGSVRLWEVESGKETRALIGPKGEVKTVVFAPDGKTLASGGSAGTVHFWDTATGKEVRTLAKLPNQVVALTYSPDGTTLAARCGNGTLQLWDVESSKEICTLSAREGLGSVAFAPDGKTVAAGSYFCVRLWEAATGKEILPSDGHREPVRSVAFAPDGKGLLSLSDFNLRRWADDGKGIENVTAQPGERFVALTADGTLMAATAGDQFRLRETATGKEIHSWKVGYRMQVPTGSLAADGKTLIVVREDGMIRVYDVAVGQERALLKGHRDRLAAVAIAPDGKTLASASGDSTVRLWHLSSGKELLTLWHPLGLRSVAFSPDGKTLASGCDDQAVRLWDTTTGKLLFTMTGHPIQCLAFSPDGKTLASGGSWNENSVRLWEVATGKQIGRWTGHRGSVHCLAFAPDARTVISGSDDTSGLVWSVLGNTSSTEEVTAKELQSFWTDLADADAVRARRAMTALSAAPRQAVPFLREQLPKSLSAADAQEAARFIADLDSKEFSVRQKAMQELEKLGPSAEPALRKALEGKPVLEVRQRLEDVLDAVTVLTADDLRWLRTIQVLELVGGTEAKALLVTMAREAPSLRQRQDATAALQRLDKHSARRD